MICLPSVQHALTEQSADVICRSGFRNYSGCCLDNIDSFVLFFLSTWRRDVPAPCVNNHVISLDN